MSNWARSARRGMCERDTGGEVRARAIAGHSDGNSLPQGPLDRLRGIIGGGGKAVLRSEAVVHGDNAAVGRNGEDAADGVVTIQIAADETSAVKIDDQRQCGVRRGPILTGAQVACQHQVFDAGQRGRRSGEHRGLAQAIPRGGDVQRGARRLVPLGLQVCGDFRIERHQVVERRRAKISR